MKEQYAQNEKKIQKIKKELKKYPEGHIICSRNGKYSKWFYSEPGKIQYIPKKNRDFALNLIIKEYWNCKLKDLQKEQGAIHSFLKHYSTGESYVDSFMEATVYKDLRDNLFRCQSEELDEWARAPYDQNPNHPEHLKYKSSTGHILRSKSEMMIDQALFYHKIPYRYECALPIGDHIFYPDFMIRHPVTGELFIWEHFGSMDKLQYAQQSINKLQMYNANGYVLNINLIVTSETSEKPLDMESIEKVINFYFS